MTRTADNIATAAPSRPARNITAFAAALIAYLATAGSLFYVAAPLQIAVLVGCLVGMFATSTWVSAAIASGVVLVGWTVVAPYTGMLVSARGDGLAFLSCLVTAVALAWVVRWVVDRLKGRTVQLVTAALVVMLIANVWLTVFGLQSRGLSELQMLDTRPIAGTTWWDHQLYVEIVARVASGQSYYQAVAGSWQDNAASAQPPYSVFDVRPPANFLVDAALVSMGLKVVDGLLLLVTAAIAAAAVLSGTLLRRQFAVVGAALVAPVFLRLANGPDAIYAEAWGVALTLIALAALVYAGTRERWKPAFVAGVALAVVAAMTREFFLCVPVVGLGATLLARSPRLRFQLRVWLTGIVVLAAYYGNHWKSAARISSHTETIAHWMHASLANYGHAVAYLEFAYDPTWVVRIVTFAGLVGLFFVPKGSARTVMAGVVAALLGAILSLETQAHTSNASAVSYWGIMLVPLLAASAPLVFGGFRGMRNPRIVRELDS